ncbi:PIR Superfamily Protein [Plasmodium ovale curtisi]|uniref:PIR Superfamily Protein n=1 Tax=Plasmodium ovale curtisi TaxID=864141 RepID=A0A1A8VYD3_PLAOA|nr:PIR Superfamily Protein [Plasmodium ovale curtisi]SBS99242.1 PIR Superfamily Protein [Plasmodium ovale curtisi]
MVSTKEDGEYLSFDEYNSYKNKLDESYISVDEVSEYQAFLKSAISEGTEGYFEIMNNCYLIKKYLLNVISDESCNNGKCCSYMNYWLNKKIENKKISLDQSDFDVYNNYIVYYNSINEKKFCVSNKFFISNNIYEEMKRLYTLYELYNTFKTTSANKDKGCMELNTCVMNYNRILHYCKPNGDSDFCKALQNFKTKFSSENSVSIRECKEKFGELKLKDLKDLPDEDVQHVDFFFIQGDEEIIHPSWFSHSNLIQTLFFSAVGISLLFLLSYKFTPFGKWMRSLLLRKNIIKHYETEEETQDILSHTYKNKNIDTEDSIHNIQYYATQNS